MVTEAPGAGKRVGMGAPGRAPPRLCCRLLFLLPLGVFLLLLSFSSLRLQLPLSACVWGGRLCHGSGERPPSPGQEGKEKKLLLLMPPVPTPTKAQDASTKVQEAPSLQAVCTQTSQGTTGFRIQDMLRAFTASITPSGEVLIWEYLQGWKELIRFMDSLGAAFGLISGETQSKISIMKQHLQGRHGPRYRTLQGMVGYELSRRLVGFHSLPPGRTPSGCRTLLRLHRALKWLQLFLHKLGASEEASGDPSQMCADAYREALAPYHSWWVRQAAALAFLAMPSRRELYHIICAEEERLAQAVLLATVQSIARVYNVTQEVYATHGMLDLP